MHRRLNDPHFYRQQYQTEGDLAPRSLMIRLDVDRADPESRPFKHPNPLGWTEKHRGEIVSAFYTILLGNPQLKTAPDAEGKTRFKMWWRLVGSAVEHAASLAGQEVEFQKLFLKQEEEDEDSTSLADVLEILAKRLPNEFTASAMKGMFDNPLSPEQGEEGHAVRTFLAPNALPGQTLPAKSIGRGSIFQFELPSSVPSATPTSPSAANARSEAEAATPF